MRARACASILAVLAACPLAHAATYGKRIAGGGGGGGFGADTIIQQNDQNGFPVNTLELQNIMDSNSHLSVTSHLDMITPTTGQQLTRRLSSLNATGVDNETTSGATPSIALKPGCDLLIITIGSTNATSLTVTGTSTDADYEYVVRGDPVIGNGSVNLQINGNTGNWTGLLRWSTSTIGGQITTSSVIANGVVDTADNGSTNTFTAFVHGPHGAVKTVDYELSSIQGTHHYIEVGTAFSSYSGGTSDATSIVLAGNLLTGTVITVRRGRPTSF